MKTRVKTAARAIRLIFGAGAVMLATHAGAQTLFVGDSAANNNVLEITPDGTISPFATATGVPAGLVFDRSGNLYVSTTLTGITEYTPGGTPRNFASGFEGGTLAFDSSGDLFAGDQNFPGSTLEFSPNGGKSTFASNFYALSVAFDQSGNFFLGNANAKDIVEYMPGGGQSVFASGFSPSFMAVDSSGDVFVSDTPDNEIFKFTPEGGESVFATLTRPSGLAFNNAGVLFVGSNNGEIYEYTPDGSQSVFVTGLQGPVELAFAPVPESSALTLLAMGGAALLARGVMWKFFYQVKMQRAVV